MKIFTTVLFLLALSVSAFGSNNLHLRKKAIKVLANEKISFKKLEQDGARLLVGGELTGAGSAVLVRNVKLIILNNDVVKSNEIQTYIPENDKKLKVNEILGVKALGETIDSEEFIGVIVK